MRPLHLSALGLAGALACLQSGCSSSNPGSDPFESSGSGAEGPVLAAGDDGVGEARQAAAAFAPGSFTLWTMPLRVCFQRGTTNASSPDYLSQSDYTTIQGWTINTLNQYWGMVPGVSFQNAGQCPISGSLVISLFNSNGPTVGTGGDCGGGVGATCRFGSSTNNGQITQPDSFFQQLVLHEVGHALGLAHEHQRTDHGPICSGVQSQLAACLNCKAAADAHQACLAADWNNCVKPNPLVTVNQSFAVGSAPYNTVLGPIGNEQVQNNLQLLTLYDPWSTMNYCKWDNGRPGDMIQPTPLDLLGVQILYPASRTSHTLGCSSGCFRTGNGNAVVTTQGAVTSDWTALGALNIVPTWTQGTFHGTNATFPAVNFSSGTITYSYVDGQNRSHSGSGTVTKSNAMFASIMGATTSAAWL